MNLRHEIAAALLWLAGLGMALALAAAPADMAPGKTASGDKHDGEILADCMNGRRISLGDGQVMTCRIRRLRM